MPQKNARLRCPLCQHTLVASRLIFREGFRCTGCGSLLYVPEAYSRTLMLTSVVIAFFLLWIAGVSGFCRFCLLWPAVALVVMYVMVRVAPLVVPPVMVPHKGGVTTLGLGDAEDGEGRKPN